MSMGGNAGGQAVLEPTRIPSTPALTCMPRPQELSGHLQACQTPTKAAGTPWDLKFSWGTRSNQDPLCFARGKIQQCSRCGKQYSSSSRSKTQTSHTIQQFHSWVHTPRNRKQY